MPGNRQRTETLDGLAWASLSEQAVIARLANKMLRDRGKHDRPTKTDFKQAISDTVPPRGRCGPMFDPLVAEYERQHPIYWERKETQAEWAGYQATITTRDYRVNKTYASIFAKGGVHLKHRNNPYHWNDEKHRKWNEAENARDKGEDCKLLIKHQGYIVAVAHDVRPVLRVKYPSGRIFSTHLRTSVNHNSFGELFTSLGGRPVTGALAHGLRVEIDYPGRRFWIHQEDGTKTQAPWLGIKVKKTGPNDWDVRQQDITIVGRKVHFDDPSQADEEEEDTGE